MNLAVVGAGGRMGRALIQAVLEHPGARVSSALERKGSDAVGIDVGVLAGAPPSGVCVTDRLDDALEAADGILDFTSPNATIQFAEEASKRNLVHIIGTTGCSANDDDRILTAAQMAPIVKSGNMSLGVNLLSALVEKAAAALDDDFDIEVVEMHHKHKVDAPSGTALLLGDAAARGRDVDLNTKSVRVRDGQTGPRERGTIGFATLRGGSVVGEHTVILAGEGERIELSHQALDRAIFARGAVKAALWARGKEPGLYSMMDVLGLS